MYIFALMKIIEEFAINILSSKKKQKKYDFIKRSERSVQIMK